MTNAYDRLESIRTVVADGMAITNEAAVFLLEELDKHRKAVNYAHQLLADWSITTSFGDGGQHAVAWVTRYLREEHAVVDRLDTLLVEMQARQDKAIGYDFNGKKFPALTTLDRLREVRFGTSLDEVVETDG